MHKALDPRVYQFDYCEPCPNCWYSIPIIIDPHEHNKYEVTCPVCGKTLMLCKVCYDEQEDTGNGICDWCEGRGCYRQKK